MWWGFLGPVSWAVSAIIFLWLLGDFVRVNREYSEESLLSSREGVDELFANQAPEARS